MANLYCEFKLSEYYTRLPCLYTFYKEFFFFNLCNRWGRVNVLGSKESRPQTPQKIYIVRRYFQYVIHFQICNISVFKYQSFFYTNTSCKKCRKQKHLLLFFFQTQICYSKWNAHYSLLLLNIISRYYTIQLQ